MTTAPVFEFEGEPVKWMIFTCPRNAEAECMISIKPQRNDVGASWEWDGNREAPTITPSVNCSGPAGCGWHGHIRNGEFVS